MRRIFSVILLMTAVTIYAQDEYRFDEVTYSPGQTTFRLFAPKDAKVMVEYACDADASAGWRKVRMKTGKDGIWTATVKKDLNHHGYRFSVDGRLSNGVFAKAVGVNGQYAQVLDMSETNPVGWEDDRRLPVASPADLVIYEMHHRDFSIARKEARNPGKFLALTEPWAIRHLTDLGVNAVHILPSYDFGSIDETRLGDKKYNWGYDPVNYNVPEGSYSTDPHTPSCRIREFKQMVQALHKAGIRVILDVVYNHTYDIEHSNFQLTYPDYYYRRVQTGIYSNGSGCGNETASEQPMMRRFMIESVKYWIDQYHIDGFRFDLMGCHDIETMNQIRKAVDEIDPTIFIYGEGWSAGQCALPVEQLGVKANVGRMPRIAAFSDEIRDALRGPFNDDTVGGFLAGMPDCEESLKFGIAGCISHPQVDMTKVNYSKEAWAEEPTQMISYVSCHDDMCLVDRLKASAFHRLTDSQSDDKSDKQKMTDSELEELIRLDLLAQTAVFTSQGVPFMLSGEEMLRDKKGVHNSYESPDSINHLNWDNMERYPQVFAYYKNLIQLRKNHPAFRLGKADLVRRHLEFLEVPRQVVAYRLKDHAGDDTWKDIIVILNGSDKEQTVNIPAGWYNFVCMNNVIDENGIAEGNYDQVLVAPKSAVILCNTE